LFFESIDVANTGLRELPERYRKCQLDWRGVRINEQIAFHPERIHAPEILAEQNVEVRRVMLERVGWEKFLEEANPEVVDRDTDVGGERRLLAVRAPGERLVVVSLRCPSTGRHYLLRVPPRTRTCHEAVAWIAGFENPRAYEPILET